MDELIEVQKKIIPHAIELMEKRYAILRQISISQPIGRRMLSVLLDISERTTRTEIDFLKEQNLIEIAGSGMTITEEGKDVLKKLDQVMIEVMGISVLQQSLKEKLGIKNIAISKNINETKEGISKGVAKCAADYILKVLKPEDIVAIAGGTTMRDIAENIKSETRYGEVTVLPTRGSVGLDIDIQANNIAALLAKNLGAKVEFLYVPDQVEDSARETIMNIPDVKNTIEDLKLADKMILSVGRADVMAKRRAMSQEDIKKLKDGGAIAEAFGYYFDKDGNIVMKLNTIGIDIEMYKNSKNPIVVFSGQDKVDSFLAMYKINKNLTLITDENSAREILNKISN
ncbi:sugar-binding transcriptional regulator [Peptostreptococcus faecalis]|uniref:sugar-binding transcriptional regulator n=1 Tax=Peptostreptococcus faecalis TaxID=2045015 RepID=UPI000C7B67C2|nr:sugar-binding domain-containing protein [Peptostreptococcus faecalis]